MIGSAMNLTDLILKFEDYISLFIFVVINKASSYEFTIYYRW